MTLTSWTRFMGAESGALEFARCRHKRTQPGLRLPAWDVQDRCVDMFCARWRHLLAVIRRPPYV